MRKKIIITFVMSLFIIGLNPMKISAKDSTISEIGTAIYLDENGTLWEDGKFAGYYNNPVDQQIGTAISLDEDGTIHENGLITGRYDFETGKTISIEKLNPEIEFSYILDNGDVYNNDEKIGTYNFSTGKIMLINEGIIGTAISLDKDGTVRENGEIIGTYDFETGKIISK